MPEQLLQEPSVIFLVIITVIFVAPLLMERARLPGIVGLIIGGILIGGHGLNLLSDGPITELFGAVGLIYLMFNAGLEIDLDQFQQVRKRTFVYGALSYILPQVSGIIIGRMLLDMNWPTSILLGSLYASQTLVAYPILTRLGIIRNEATSISVGATIITDILSLLVLGVIVGSQGQSLSLIFLLRLVLFTGVYAALILFGIPKLGRFFFRRFNGRIVEFQFLLIVLFIAAVLAELIGMHTIVGAFLAGLAINLTLSKDSRSVRQVIFLGESFFVPMFLITVGVRLDPRAIFTSTETLLVGILLTAAVLITKFLASWITSRIYGYSRDQMLTTWGLSQAQAAATLATILVATEANIFTDKIFNASFLMILVTSITSPIIVERFGNRMKPPTEKDENRPLFKRIMVPVLNSKRPDDLLELGALLARISDGKLLVLNRATKNLTLKKKRESLREEVLKDPETEVSLRHRIEEISPEGILKEAVESEASLILIDWSNGKRSAGRMLDEVVDGVFWGAKVPVITAKLKMNIKTFERVVFVIAANTVGVKLDGQSIEAALDIAKALDLPSLVMATDHYFDEVSARLKNEVAEKNQQIMRVSTDDEDSIVGQIKEADLVLLPAMGSQTRLSASPDRLLYKLYKRLNSSLAILHFP